MTENALVVVDMQPKFPASSVVFGEVEQLIKDAREREDWIFILEFISFGETYEDLASGVLGYKKHFYSRKDLDDGSPEIEAICENLGIKISEFMVCGVNRSACVLDTVCGLARRMPKSEVLLVEEATCDGGSSADVDPMKVVRNWQTRNRFKVVNMNKEEVKL